MKFRVKQYEFRGYILNDIVSQIKLSFNSVIKNYDLGKKLKRGKGKV